MNKRGVADWIKQVAINQILLSFSAPKTPRQVEKELGIKKLKLKPFLEKHLLETLNPEARKGRFYILTSKARRLLKLPSSKKGNNKDWDLIGWIMASPKQRLVVLRFVNSEKRTSEEIREKTSQLNPHLSRISTKGILKELINEGLVETEMLDRKRYYWLSEEGLDIKKSLKLFLSDITI
jgi:hypothetical protein